IVMHVSLPWLQKKRCEGGGIPFSKPHKRQVNYVKADVLAYIEQNKMAHTA
ncbi:DNA-binding protein, partial [Acinetobacter baumannii]